MQDFASAGMPELRSVIPRSFAAYASKSVNAQASKLAVHFRFACALAQ
jgi:hypothetical protein